MHTFALSLTALAVLASQADSYTFKSQYPPSKWDPKLGHIPVPDTNSALVKKWVAAVNMSAIPNIPLSTTKNNDGYTVNFTPAMKDYCNWSFDPAGVAGGCDKTDVFVCPNVGNWGLSYDDGPTLASPALYDYLDTIQQKATLFYIGSAVFNFPEIAITGCKAMHQIGSHSWSHNLLTTLTNEQVIAEMQYTAMIVKELCGFTPKYMRPPFGDMDARVRALMGQMGYIPVIWDYDTNDWSLPPAPGATQTPEKVDALFTSWIANRTTDTKGHICLEHELYNSSVAASIKNLPNLKKAFNVMTVQACIRDPYPYLEKQFVFPVVDAQGVNLINSTQVPSTNTNTATASTGANNSAVANPSASIANANVTAVLPNRITSGATTAMPAALSVFSILAALTYTSM